MMLNRELGRTGISVSELGFGCSRIGGIFNDLSRKETIAMLHEALDSGITFYDTAAIYGGGESEELLGEAFSSRRDSVVLATKGGYGFPAKRTAFMRLRPLVKGVVQGLGLRRDHMPAALRPGPRHDFSAAALTASLRTSLRRLRTDYVDLYMLHSPPPEASINSEALEFFRRAKRDGIIRAFGVSCDSASDAAPWLQTGEVDALQVGISLVEQQAIPELLMQAKLAQIGIVARQCFAGGMLAKPPSAQLDLSPAGQSAIADYAASAERLRRSLPEVAYHFVSDQDGVTTTLIGIRTPVHLRDAVLFAESPPLSAGEADRLVHRDVSTTIAPGTPTLP